MRSPWPTPEAVRATYEEVYNATNSTTAMTYISRGPERPRPYRLDFHEVILKENRIVFIQFVSPYFEGPMLGQFAINKPLTPIVRSGVIDLPQPNIEK